MRSTRTAALLLAAVVCLNTGAGFGIVGDSVTTDAREELRPYGATVLANGGVDIVRGRPAIRLLAGEGRRRVVIELGLMDVSFWSTRDELRRRIRAVLRDDIDGIGCVIWVDMKTSSTHPLWAERSGEFNEVLNRQARQFGVQVARWSRFAEHHRDWFRRDGIHLNPTGQRGYAKWIDGRVDALC